MLLAVQSVASNEMSSSSLVCNITEFWLTYLIRRHKNVLTVISVLSSTSIEKGVFLIASTNLQPLQEPFIAESYRIFVTIFVHLNLCICTFFITSESSIISLRRGIKWTTIWNATLC